MPATIRLDATSTGCALNAGVITFTAVGTCVLDASQAGNADYTPAAPVSQSMTIVARPITPAELEALTLDDVVSSALFRGFPSREQGFFYLLLKADLSVLNWIGPNTPDYIEAPIIAWYRFIVLGDRGAGLLTTPQAATLIADASSL